MANSTLKSQKNQSTLIVIVVLIMLMGLTNSILAQSHQIFTTSGSFTVPAGVSVVVVQCWGAGGGGSSITDNGVAGGGGGGGAYASALVSVVPNNSYSLVVGTGGAANSNGGNSTFNTNSVIAAGGNGASSNSSIAGEGGTVANSTGTTKQAGGNGANGDVANSGGGGGAAGTSGSGNSAVTNTGGAAKAANGGAGANGVADSNNGLNGTNYGGGGSGAVTNSDTDNDGGTGADGLVIVSWSTANCLYADNSYSGITFTPSVNMSASPETVSSTFTSNSYFILNVIKGLTYEIYTCSSPISPLKMAVYEEGNAAAAAIASSTSNVGNTCNTHTNNIYKSFTSPLSGQVRVLINSMADCASAAITGLTVNVNVSGGSNTQDDPTAAGTDSWIGHIYDGSSFNKYLGYYTQPENFEESYGTSGTWPNTALDDATNYYQVHSNGTIRAGVKVASYSVRYRMNSTRRGMYTTQFVSDDGARLYVDGNLVFSDWNAHSKRTYTNVLIPYSGNSALVYEYYEQGGHNMLGFGLLTQIFSNDLTTNLNQTICAGNVGVAISGNIYSGAFPAGIALQGTGYQWSYSTSPTGARTNIAGATAATYIPDARTAPFITPGTYYIYRNSTLSSTNNYIAAFSTSSESVAAILTVDPCNNYWTGAANSNWGNTSNWSEGFVPAYGQDVEFATTANNGTAVSNDLILDTIRVVGSLVNASDKKLVIPPTKMLTVINNITTDGNEDRIYIQASESSANGTLIFHNDAANPVSATVEMYSKASWDLGASAPNKYKWQFFGIPLRSVTAFGTFNGSYVRLQNEPGGSTNYWIQLQNGNTLSSFSGYEIVQAMPTKYYYKGILENRNISKTLTYSTGAKYIGQHLIGNSYTAAIDIQQLTFGANTEAAVYLYNTGSFANWDAHKSLTNPEGMNPGQYTASTPATAGVDLGIPRQIPSMQAFLVKCTAASTLNITYNSVTFANADRQRAPSAQKSEKIFTRIEVIGSNSIDRMWLFTDASCTKAFDNGWDARKFLGSASSPQIFSKEMNETYQINAVDDINNANIAFLPGQDSNYTLRFHHQNMNDNYADIYLLDLMNNTTTNITSDGSEYTFAAGAIAPDSIRFKILTAPQMTTESKAEKQSAKYGLTVLNIQNCIVVQNRSELKGLIELSDLSGRSIDKQMIAPHSIISISNKIPQGTYIINIHTDKVRLTEKIIIR